MHSCTIHLIFNTERVKHYPQGVNVLFPLFCSLERNQLIQHITHHRESLLQAHQHLLLLKDDQLLLGWSQPAL